MAQEVPLARLGKSIIDRGNPQGKSCWVAFLLGTLLWPRKEKYEVNVLMYKLF